MNWKYVKKLQTTDLISEFESKVEYSFDDFFKKTIKEYNGGRPENSAFDTDKVKGRSFKSLLSFNKDDRETVWKVAQWNERELFGRYVAFGIDNFGNLICFDTTNGSVVFLENESLKVENVAENFAKFLQCLYTD